jgi:hypothetical protein
MTGVNGRESWEGQKALVSWQLYYCQSTKCSTTLATLTTSADDQTPSGVVRFAGVGAFLSLSFRPFAAERFIFIGS